MAGARKALDDTAAMRGKDLLTSLKIKVLREEIAHYCALGVRVVDWRAAACAGEVWPPSVSSECLNKHRDVLLTFYDFPAEHWKHLRTTNPIESTFATVRHRTVRSKGCLSNRTALALVFKLVEAAQNIWRRLDGNNQLPKTHSRCEIHQWA